LSRLLQSIDKRTKLVGENRLELLMFRLGGQQLFAINVFKVKEVMYTPPLTVLPHSNPHVRGVAHIRNHAVPVIDLQASIGGRNLPITEESNIIVTEYNRSVQAFLIGSIDRIVNLNWDLIQPPPAGAGRAHFLTAITQLDDKIVEIIDVEKVLAGIIPYDTSVSDDAVDTDLVDYARSHHIKVLLADDSSTAISQVVETMHNIGVEVIAVQNGLKALRRLQQWNREGKNIDDEILMLITDAEMPEMDGYRLTHEIRADPALAELYVVLHTSLSGSFNESMVEKVGCNDFLSKFQPDDLAKCVQKRLRQKIQS